MDNNPSKKLWASLNEKGLYTKDYNAFQEQFKDEGARQRLHSSLTKEGLYTKEFGDFSLQFFEKKNPASSESLEKSNGGLPAPQPARTAGVDWANPIQPEQSKPAQAPTPPPQKSTSPWESNSQEPVQSIVSPNQVGPEANLKKTTVDPRFAKEAEEDAAKTRVEQRRGLKGDYWKTGDQIAMMNEEDASTLQQRLRNRSPFERALYKNEKFEPKYYQDGDYIDQSTLKRLEWEYTAIQTDMTDLSLALSAVDREINATMADDVQKNIALAEQINGLEKRINVFSKDPEVSTSESKNREYNDMVFQLTEMKNQLKEFNNRPIIVQREEMARALSLNYDKALSLSQEDRFKTVRKLFSTMEATQTVQDAAADVLPYNQIGGHIGMKGLARLSAGIGTLMDIGETLIVGDEEYTKWDAVEDYLKGVSKDTESLLPTPSKWARPLFTETATWGEYQVDIKDNKIQAVFDKNGQRLRGGLDKNTEGKILALPRKEQYNPSGLPYKVATATVDMLLQMAATKGIGGVLPSALSDVARGTIAVTGSNIGMMANSLYEEGMEIFDGDKKKASKYAIETGTLIGIGSNMFGLEARLAGVGKGFMDDLMNPSALGRAATPIKRAVEILKGGTGEMFEETILENAMRNVVAMGLNSNLDVDYKQMKEDGVIAFSVGAIMGASSPIQNDIQGSSILAASKNIEGFKTTLSTLIDNGQVMVPESEGKTSEQAKAEFIELAAQRVSVYAATAELLPEEKRVQAMPLIEQRAKLKEQQQKAEAAKMPVMVEKIKAEIEAIDQQLVNGQVEEVESPSSNNEPASATVVSVSELEGKRVVYNGFAGNVAQNEETGKYEVVGNDDSIEIEETNGINTETDIRVLPDISVQSDGEFVTIQGVNGGNPLTIVDETVNEDGDVVAIEMQNESGKSYTATNATVVAEVVAAKETLDNKIDFNNEQQVESASEILSDELIASEGEGVKEVISIVNTMPDSVASAFSESGSDASVLSEDAKNEAIAWMDTVLPQIAGLPKTDFVKNIYENILKLKYEINASQKRDNVPVAQIEQKPNENTEEASQDEAINSEPSAEADQYDVTIDELNAFDTEAADDAINNEVDRVNVIDETGGPAEIKPLAINEALEALDQVLIEIGSAMGLKQDLTDEELTKKLEALSFTKQMKGFIVSVVNGRVTLDGSFGNVSFAIDDVAGLIRKNLGIKKPTQKQRKNLKDISKRLLNQSATDDIAIAFANGVRISEADLAKYGDPNWVKDNPAIRFHFVRKTNTTKVDQWAQQLAETWGISEDAAIQEIMEFVSRNSTGDYLRGRIEEQGRGHAEHPMFEDEDTSDLSQEEVKEIYEEVISATDELFSKLNDQEKKELSTWIAVSTDEDGNVNTEELLKSIGDKEFATQFLNMSENLYNAIRSSVEHVSADYSENASESSNSFAQESNEAYRPSKTLKQKEIEEALSIAIREVATASKALTSKRNELNKRLQEDQSDLFGERQSQSSGMIFDERVDSSAVAQILAPFNRRLDVARSEVKRLEQLLEQAKTEKDITLFDQNETGPDVVKMGLPISEDLSKAVDKFIQETFYSKGMLNSEIFELNQERVAQINSQMELVRQTKRRFDKALKDIFGKNGPTKEQLEDLDLALKNPTLMSGGIVLYRDGSPIETKLRASLREMRLQVDSLSGELVALGIAQGDLAITILENQDSYLTRAYRIHDDKKWIDSVQKLPVWNKAVAWFKANQVDVVSSLEEARLHYEEMANKASHKLNDAIARQVNTLPGTIQRQWAVNAEANAKKAYRFWQTKIAEIDKAIDEETTKYDNPEANLIAMLQEQQDNLAIAGVAKSGSLGSKNLGIFSHRKDIPKEIRDIFGEYLDPVANYAKSIYKQIHLIENAKFLRQVETQGLGTFLFTSPRGNFTAKIAAEGSKTMSPLNGYYTTPELAQAFKEFNEPSTMPSWLYPMVFMSSIAKYAKTILSVVTHVRNFFFNEFFHIANGRIGSVAALKEAWEIVKADVDFMASGDKNAEARLRHLIELGVLGESVTFQEMMSLMNDVKDTWDNIGESSFVRPVKKAVGKTLEVAEQLYQAEDDFHKVIAFEVEKARYAKAIYKKKFNDLNFSQKQDIENRAAKIVTGTMPTYSLVPKNIQELRRIPFVGTFVSFPYETLRTTKNTINLAIDEMKEPDTRSIGISRVLGMASATAGTIALSKIMHMMLGFDKDDEDYIRWFLPPWSENSIILPVKRNGADMSYVDITSVVPHGYILSIMNSLFDKRKNVTDRGKGFIETMLRPFFSQDMVFSRLSEAIKNESKSGKPIAAQDSPDNVRKRLLYASEVFVPGSISTASRIWKSLTKPELDYYGRLYPSVEIGTLLTGIRVSPANFEGSFLFRAKDLADRARSDKQIYYKERNKQIYGDMSQEEKAKALAPFKQKSKDAWRVMFIDALECYKAAVALGANPKVLKEHLSDAGFNAKEIEMIQAGMMMEPVFSDDVVTKKRAKRKKREPRANK